MPPPMCSPKHWCVSLPHRAGLIRLLVAVLLLQTVLAPAHCLGRRLGLSGTLTIEICTVDGLRTLHPGPGDPAVPPQAGRDGFCLACHALPHAATPPVPVLPPPAWVAVGLAWAPSGHPAPPPAIRGPPAGARAPPVLS